MNSSTQSPIYLSDNAISYLKAAPFVEDLAEYAGTLNKIYGAGDSEAPAGPVSLNAKPIPVEIGQPGDDDHTKTLYGLFNPTHVDVIPQERTMNIIGDSKTLAQYNFIDNLDFAFGDTLKPAMQFLTTLLNAYKSDKSSKNFMDGHNDLGYNLKDVIKMFFDKIHLGDFLPQLSTEAS